MLKSQEIRWSDCFIQIYHHLTPRKDLLLHYRMCIASSANPLGRTSIENAAITYMRLKIYILIPEKELFIDPNSTNTSKEQRKGEINDKT